MSVRPLTWRHTAWTVWLRCPFGANRRAPRQVRTGRMRLDACAPVQKAPCGGQPVDSLCTGARDKMFAD